MANLSSVQALKLLKATVASDQALTEAQKAQAHTLLYALSHALFQQQHA